MPFIEAMVVDPQTNHLFILAHNNTIDAITWLLAYNLQTHQITPVRLNYNSNHLFIDPKIGGVWLNAPTATYWNGDTTKPVKLEAVNEPLQALIPTAALAPQTAWQEGPPITQTMIITNSNQPRTPFAVLYPFFNARPVYQVDSQGQQTVVLDKPSLAFERPDADPVFFIPEQSIIVDSLSNTIRLDIPPSNQSNTGLFGLYSFSPDNNELVFTPQGSQTLLLVDLQTGAQQAFPLADLGPNLVNRFIIGWSNSGIYLYTFSTKPQIMRFDPKTGTFSEVLTLETSLDIATYKLNATTNRLAYRTSNEFVVYNLANQIEELRIATNNIQWHDFAPDNSLIWLEYQQASYMIVFYRLKPGQTESEIIYQTNQIINLQANQAPIWFSIHGDKLVYAMNKQDSQYHTYLILDLVTLQTEQLITPIRIYEMTDQGISGRITVGSPVQNYLVYTSQNPTVANIIAPLEAWDTTLSGYSIHMLKP